MKSAAASGIASPFDVSGAPGVGIAEVRSEFDPELYRRFVLSCVRPRSECIW